MSYLNRFSENDIIIRALKTFVQASVAVWLVSDNPLSKSALVGAVAAGISAVWNFTKQTL
jgi:hypothetical protein